MRVVSMGLDKRLSPGFHILTAALRFCSDAIDSNKLSRALEDCGDNRAGREANQGTGTGVAGVRHGHEGRSQRGSGPMSEIASLEEARKNRARQKRNDPVARAVGPPLTDSERINITVESLKLAYQAILEIFERLEALEDARKTS